MTELKLEHHVTSLPPSVLFPSQQFLLPLFFLTTYSFSKAHPPLAPHFQTTLFSLLPCNKLFSQIFQKPHSFFIFSFPWGLAPIFLESGSFVPV